jgi:UDP-N-acetylglucosamine 1-carboxyvinyltransferase
MIRLVFARLGLETQIEGTMLVVPGGQRLAVSDDLGGVVPTVDDAPWPGFPADLTPTALVLATQCVGTVLIQSSSRAVFFVDRLIDIGRAGRAVRPAPGGGGGAEPAPRATMVSPDIRAGMALLGAARCARGTSHIRNARQIDHGYERIDERLRELGACITRG